MNSWQIIHVILFLSSTASCVQEWARQPQPTKALEGQDAVIACKVHNKVELFEEDNDDDDDLSNCSRLVNVSGGRITV